MKKIAILGSTGSIGTQTLDIVSKNGNLLLSVPLRADGTFDEKEEKISVSYTHLTLPTIA